jgi:phospholipase C
LQWPAFAQYLDEAGVDWRSYQNSWDWATNSGLFYFEAFQQASPNSSLYKRGLAFDGDNGLDAFKAAAANGSLPEVAWVFPPGSLQEHPPQTPKDGAWFIDQIVHSILTGPNYNETIFMLNWDGESRKALSSKAVPPSHPFKADPGWQKPEAGAMPCLP